uniref:N-alpha-acetyltransferase 30 n=1 Tax=Anas platyrhynchos platyrhynchos TaxID=8840 RepID=A0A493ST72_ANAPP
MAEVPPGPSRGGGGGAASSSSSSSSSSTSAAAAASACAGAQDEEAEEEEEEEGPAGGREHPELRHLRASLKSKILGSEAGAAPEGQENKRASKTMGSGQQQQASPPATAPSQPAGDEGGEEEESLLLLSRSLAAACSLKGSGTDSQPEEDLTIRYVRYESELQMPDIMRLITKDLSEPYSIYTYRYFIHNWPQLCFLAMVGEECVGAIVCKLDMHKKMFRRGYIAMLAVDSKYRRKGIGTNLVKKAIYAMVEGDCDEVVLETEITNKSALKLYENLGFVRDKRLFRYYLNGVDALRLKLWLR